MSIRVIGPSNYSRYAGHPFLVDVTAHSAAPWSKGLAPEVLGPVALYGGRKAQTMRNGWEHCKVFSANVGEDGQPSPQYWDWATNGWNSLAIDKQSKGKSSERPEFFWWEGKRMNALDARKRIYWPLYRNAVALTPAFTHLKAMVERCPEVVLFDFEGYDEEAEDLTLKDVVLDLRRNLSHAFVLKAMLLHGEQVTPEDVLSNNAQISLF